MITAAPQIGLIRAWDKDLRKFLENGSLSLDGYFATKEPAGAPRLAAVDIDFFTGMLAADNTPVYQNDRVLLDASNEFGSMTEHQAVIVYEPAQMRYIPDIALKEGEAAAGDFVGSYTIKTVIGHIHV